MQVFLTILMILSALAALAMLVRGVVLFLMTSRADLDSGAVGPSQSGLKQNKAMQGRILFQAVAILLAVLLLAVARQHS